jgi:predicted porin
MTKAVAVAVLAMGASAAQAGITIPAGDWTIDIGGNVNAYYNHTNFSGRYNQENTNTVNTGLLPSAIGFGGKTRQNDLDIAFQFTFFTGIDSTNNPISAGAHGYGSNAALGMNSLNIRQAFMTFGDKSWGTIKMGRDLGIYESDAILSDMTLLGVGSGAGGTGNTTLGRIGYGYLYADWKSQIQYASPNWNGFSFAVAVDTPWVSNHVSDAASNEDMGFEGKASYEWGGDVSGKVWVGGITQKVNYTAAFGAIAGNKNDETARGWDIGGKVAVAGFEAVASYYDGEGIGRTGFLLDGFAADGRSRDSDGWYVQGTYKIPTVGTKIGLSYGESNLDRANSTDTALESTAGAAQLAEKHKSWVVGAYHPLTKSLNLVAEYTDSKDEFKNSQDGKARTVSLGAILFF